MSTLSGHATFIEMIIGGGQWRGRRIITDETLHMMRTNQLAEGVHVNFPDLPLPGTMFGLGFSPRDMSFSETPEGSSNLAHG